jgi:PAS domain S-box-containing protein
LPSIETKSRPTSLENSDDEQVLLIAPLGHDAAAIAGLLRDRGFQVRVCNDPTECGEQITKGAGALLVTEEAFELPQVANLFEAVKKQPAWSELPLIVLTSGGEPRLAQLIDQAADLAGNVILLELPLGTITLVRAIEGALNSRRRQYRVRDLLQEQQRIHTALRESEALLRTVTNEARVGLVIVDQERRYIFANRTFAEILGLPDHSLIGKRVSDVLSDVYDQIGPHLDRAFKGERVSYELNMQRHPKSGVQRIYEIIYEPRMTDPAGPYVVVVIVDITERKLVQQTLERAVAERTSELKETNDQLEAFVYSIAHDLRSPLRATQGYTEILMETASRDQMPMLKRISASTSYMDRMIIDLLEFGRAARAQITFSPVAVQNAWQAALGQNVATIEKTNAKIAAHGDFPTVCAFEPILVQSLSNLLANAMKFVAPGVTPRIRFWSEDKGRTVRLWLEDNGIGIEPQYHDRIFRVFERLHNSQYDGTGIGLAIVRKGIERLNGKVGLESKPGKGSQFWIELPKA